jgi:LysR family hydrogen peroxide-inducible transcriptional activator
MQIKALEEELGVMLLDRSKKPVVPTEAGEAVLEQVRNTLREFHTIKEVVQQLKGEVSGQIRLGVIPTIAPYLLHKFVPEFVQRYPKVDIEVREMKTADIIEALNRDLIDVGLLAGGTCGDSFNEYELFDDKFYAYVSPRNSLYNKSNIRLEDIKINDLVLLSSGNCMRDQVIELCQAKNSLPSRYTFESGQLDTLMRIVDNTSLMTIIPKMALDFVPEERKRQVKTLFKGASSRKIALVTRRSYVKKSIVDALRSTISEYK